MQRILDKAVSGERLTPDEGLVLIESHDLAPLGRAADAVTRRLHPESYRTYNIDRNINYTNICTAVCDFCAFYRKPKHAEGYVLDVRLWGKGTLSGVEIDQRFAFLYSFRPDGKVIRAQLFPDVAAAVAVAEASAPQPV